MRPDPKLWRKAAVLGSLWASFEIVLGSFLHNAQFPLSGHVLSGIGIALLVAGRRLWPERGLLWRAGVICAAMKSVSPSAFLISPMIAIAIEGALLELGTVAGGGGTLGLVLGGGLAMSWNLFHKAARLLIFYGPGAAAVYIKGLHAVLPLANPWTPVFVLWAAHFAGGGLAAGIGLRAASDSAAIAPLPASSVSIRPRLKPRTPVLLLLHLAAISGTLFALSTLGLRFTAPLILGYVLICLFFYPNALRRLGRPRLWLGLIGFCVLAGFLLKRPMLGAEMALRALMLSVGFAAVGAELRNPLLRRWLERFGAGAFFSALDAAFETLPAVLAAAPTGRQLFRRPLAALRQSLAQAPLWLDRLEQRAPEVHIVTGEKGAGKSTLVAELSREFRGRGKAVGGIHAPGLWSQGRRTGFDVVDLGTGQKESLCLLEGPVEWTHLGPFRFSPEGMRFGLRALARAREQDVDLLVVDEVGPLELRGEGWAPELDRLAAERRKPMLWVVRSSAVDDVRRRWGLDVATVWEAGRSNAEQIVHALSS